MLLNDFSASESVALSENYVNNDNAILAFSAVLSSFIIVLTRSNTFFVFSSLFFFKLVVTNFAISSNSFFEKSSGSSLSYETHLPLINILSSSSQMHIFSKGTLPPTQRAHLLESEDLHNRQLVIFQHSVPSILELEDFLTHYFFSLWNS